MRPWWSSRAANPGSAHAAGWQAAAAPRGIEPFGAGTWPALQSSLTKPALVVFSSTSCGNCPAANANLQKLAERSDIIALTYPVGIWDYLGWDDTFAKPEFTERQKRYNRVLGYRGPYTPQVVYSGRLHGPGTSIKQIEEKFAVRDISPYPASIAFDKDVVTVSGALPDKMDKAGVMLVKFRPGQTKVTPGGGANKGKAMTYWNLVTGFEQIGEWKGGSQKFAGLS